ncbi:hypothetical protein D3C86_2111720 [compost metagenome]
MTPAPQAELLWQLSIEPGPMARADGLFDDLAHNQINPQLALCTHLIALMNGELSLESPRPDGPLAVLTVRFAQAL